MSAPLQAALRRDARAKVHAYARWLASEATLRPFRVIACERAVTLPLGDVTLSGTIDRIDERADGVRILRDFKTGRMKTKKFAAALAASAGASGVGDVDPDLNAQLALYAPAEPDATVLSYLFLGGGAGDDDGGIAVSDEANRGDEATEHGISALHRLLAEDFTRSASDARSVVATAVDERECASCAFASICVRGDDAWKRAFA